SCTTATNRCRASHGPTPSPRPRSSRRSESTLDGPDGPPGSAAPGRSCRLPHQMDLDLASGAADHRPDPSALVERSRSLEPLPASAAALAGLLNRDEWALREVEDVVRADLGLTS